MRNKIIRFLMASIIVITGGISLALAESTPSVKRGISDQWITWRIDALLHNDNRFDYRELKVTTKNGIVTLKGSVKTDYKKAHAALVAGDLPPVKGVVNNIVVWEPVDSDFALLKRIRSQIIQDPIFRVIALDVDTENGAVTLYGIVRSSEQKKLIGEFVQEIPGVKQLTNDLLVE